MTIISKWRKQLRQIKGLELKAGLLEGEMMPE